MAMHSQVVVLGGGPGGYAAAFLAADLGLEVTIVEADPRLGGTCLLRGCIPSKALLHVAKVISEAGEMTGWGVEFTRPQIQIDRMRARKEQVIETLSGGLAQLAKRRNVRVVNARGIFVDSQTLQLEGGNSATYDSSRLTFDHCILATGSKPTVPKIFQLPTDRVMDSTAALHIPRIAGASPCITKAMCGRDEANASSAARPPSHVATTSRSPDRPTNTASTPGAASSPRAPVSACVTSAGSAPSRKRATTTCRTPGIASVLVRGSVIASIVGADRGTRCPLDAWRSW